LAKAADSSARAAGFVADPADVYAFTGRFFAALVAAGVEHVCLSPGSRSTPLTIAADRTPGLRTWIQLDERAAGFFALGLAKASRRPAVLVCTSGTAAANYLPAIVEAHYSRVPLVVLTADRPPELRDWGAGQTIDQPGLYGRYPRWSVEVPIAIGGDEAERYATRLAARAVEMASGRPAGPVHLNWPLREPLAPPIASATAPATASEPDVAASASDPGLHFSRGRVVADDSDVDALSALVADRERGVVCCGPMDPDPELVRSIVDFSAASGWPIVADPVSQLRSARGARAATILASGDALARAPDFAGSHRPEVVIRIGESPVSKAQRLWLEASEPREVWWLDEGSSWGEPSHRATRVVRGGGAALLRETVDALGARARGASDWTRAFVDAERRARAALTDFLATRLAEASLSGLAVAERLADRLPEDVLLFASNSMAIRLLDLGLARSEGGPRVLCNRGASGIDGVTSSALGAAAAAGRGLLLTGDLAFLHDLGGLLVARQAAIDLVIVVLDDDGGGIFSFLPVAEQGETVGFDRLFRTPHGLDLARVAALFELGYARVVDPGQIDDALEAAFGRSGVSIVHVPLDARGNEQAFRDAVGTVVRAVDAGVEGGAGA